MIKQQVTQAIVAALESARKDGSLRLDPMPEVQIETPADRAKGDYTTNVAMLAAGQEGLEPREVAARIVSHLPAGQGIQRAEVAGPGSINLYLTPETLRGVVHAVRQQAGGYGRSNEGAGRKVQLEFVSANPNGPLHVGHGRAAALGDAIARLLDWTGWAVTREYYVNDATNSTQMVNFGRSLYARYQQALGRDVPMPEDGYEGDYVAEIAQRIVEREGDRYLALPEQECIRIFTDLALKEMLARQRDELQAFGVEYDVWFSEQQLHDSGAVKEAVEALKAGGWAYEAEDALWLRSTRTGDDKDRVLVRSNGAPTYLAADAAYHRNKFARGFEKVIDIWGPDHHGYVMRTKAAMAALGIDPDRLVILIHQMVRLFKGGEVVRMSKSAGDVIPLADLVGEVGKDAARFFFLMRKADNLLDFDIDLAKKQSRENPVHSVQDAHARACGVASQAQGVLLAGDADLGPLQDESERALMLKLSEFPEEVAAAGATLEPDRLASYAQELATGFHAFCDEGISQDVTAARLALVDATRIVLANALGILGIAALERM